MPTNAITWNATASQGATKDNHGSSQAKSLPKNTRKGLGLFCPSYGMPSSQAHRRASNRAQHYRNKIFRPHKLVNGCTARYSLAGNRWFPTATVERDLRRLWQCRYWWPLRGGYGCQRVIPTIVTLAKKLGPPPTLIGFSDLTAWHALWRHQQWGETIHGFMPGTASGARAFQTLQQIVRAQTATQLVTADATQPTASARGWCFAGCLRILSGRCGTGTMPDMRGAVLWLEDIDERPYAIDRDLWQLYSGGHLDGIHGMIWGRFPHQEPPGSKAPTIGDLAHEWSQRLQIPLWYNLPFGHDADPLSLPIGRQMRIAPCS
jgi:muramoyltetrapeptide carboxypeptidase